MVYRYIVDEPIFALPNICCNVVEDLSSDALVCVSRRASTHTALAIKVPLTCKFSTLLN